MMGADYAHYHPHRRIFVPASDIGPQPVSFTLTSVNPFTQVQLDGNGDGSIDVTDTSLLGVSVSFAEPGLYFPSVQVTEQDGTVRTATSLIQVVDSTQLDAALQSKWTAMKNSLRQGDINLALTHIVLRRRSTYQAMFTA
jgi:hypothetical protein